MNKNAECESKGQAPIANEVLELTASVAVMARQVAEKLESKLNPVMVSSSPQPACAPGTTCREYPPLFSEWNSHIASIRESLEIIVDCIRRTEL